MSAKVLTRIVVNSMTGSNNPNDSVDEPTVRQAERALAATEKNNNARVTIENEWCKIIGIKTISKNLK